MVEVLVTTPPPPDCPPGVRCAPECINYLRFTSSSDVWAYGVTLWEMFSYGFQPWAALTGQQILEAIDEPNFQVRRVVGDVCRNCMCQGLYVEIVCMCQGPGMTRLYRGRLK